MLGLSRRTEEPRHLHGSVRYGDNVEAEWLVVAILLQLTRRFTRLVARYRPTTRRVTFSFGRQMLNKLKAGLLDINTHTWCMTESSC